MPVIPAHTNYIKHLNAFFAKVRTDDRLNATHISLYMALFHVWNQHRFCSPFPIVREEIMKLSRIGSRSTYVKCLRQLHDYAYIIYQQSSLAYAPSRVAMIPLNGILPEKENQQLFLFSPTNQVQNEPGYLSKTGPHTWPIIGPHSGPKVGLFYKHINNSKQERENRLTPSKKNKNDKAEKAPTRQDAPRAEISASNTRNLPTLSQVQEFFNAHQYPALEGDKFYHHYQANGWRQGGQSLILDWQAAAHKWILNIHSQNQTGNDKHTKSPSGAGRLHSNENKSYSDPL
jgi:hypothetical protein